MSFSNLPVWEMASDERSVDTWLWESLNYKHKIAKHFEKHTQADSSS